MSRRSRLLTILVVSIAAPLTTAPAANAAVNPCDFPGASHVCDIPGDVLSGTADAAGEAVMRGVTSWVTHFAVWVTGEVGDLISATASPDVQAGWFRQQYATMLAIAGALALPMLMLAVIQAVMRQDIAMVVRSAFGYLPMAFILAAAAILATQLLIQITDDLSLAVTHGFGNGDNLLQRVGDAYSHAVDDNQGNTVPLFGAFLGALVLAVGALMLWLELVIRDATIYIALFFLPLTFVAMVWPATSRYARRLVEFLVAVILSKLVIVAIISLATAALTHSTMMAGGTSASASAGDHVFERMVAGAALLLLAAYSPFALLRTIPLLEGAAASVGQSRQTMGGAAASAGVQSPAAYMRSAMNREPSGYAAPSSSGPVFTTGGGSAPRAKPPNASGRDSQRATHTPNRTGGERAPASAGAPTAGTVVATRPPDNQTTTDSPRPRPASPPVGDSIAQPPPRDPPSRLDPPRDPPKERS